MLLTLVSPVWTPPLVPSPSQLSYRFISRFAVRFEYLSHWSNHNQLDSLDLIVDPRKRIENSKVLIGFYFFKS